MFWSNSPSESVVQGKKTSVLLVLEFADASQAAVRENEIKAYSTFEAIFQNVE